MSAVNDGNLIGGAEFTTELRAIGANEQACGLLMMFGAIHHIRGRTSRYIMSVFFVASKHQTPAAEVRSGRRFRRAWF